MARPLRIHFDGAWYHVMSRGINRNNIFYNDIQRETFLELLSKAITIYGVEIHAYCLMTNHYHLILHTPRGNISHAMKYINSNYAQFVNMTMNRDGPLFKGRFKAIVISADDYLINLSRYIHMNPMEAKILDSLISYKWSSYPAYLEKCSRPNWLSTHEIIKRFGAKQFAKSYKSFVESKRNKPTDYFTNAIYKPVLGDDDFCRMIDEYINSHSLSAEIVGKNRIVTPPSIEAILKLVASHFDIKPAQIYKSTNGVSNPARKIAIYICREFGGYHLHEIGKFMGGVTYKAIASVINRIKYNREQMLIAKLLIKKLKKRT